MIAMLMFAALAGAPNSGVEFNLGEVNPATFNYIQTYTYCFEDAAIATKEAPQELRTTRFEQCYSKRPALVTQYSSAAGPSEVRGFERSLNIIERAYAKAMGVPLSETK
jgi:hypothetical protein